MQNKVQGAWDLILQCQIPNRINTSIPTFIYTFLRNENGPLDKLLGRLFSI